MGQCITRSLCYSLDAVGSSERSWTWLGLALQQLVGKLLGVGRIVSPNSISGFLKFAVRCQSQAICENNIWNSWRDLSSSFRPLFPFNRQLMVRGRIDFPTRPIPEWLRFLLDEWPNHPSFLHENTRLYPLWWYSHHIPIYPHLSPFTSYFFTNRPVNRPPK